jgi:hypothetical protein
MRKQEMPRSACFAAIAAEFLPGVLGSVRKAPAGLDGALPSGIAIRD